MGETIAVNAGDGKFSAYLARPTKAKGPAVVVIQEIFGVNAVMRAIADDLAREGYLAVCPDLFWRTQPGIDITDQSPEEWRQAFELYNAFDVDAGMADIAATITAIRGHPACSGPVGAVGFCLGGLLAFLASARTDANASVSYYGVGIDKHLSEISKVSRPLLLHIAQEDEFTPAAAQEQIIVALEGFPQIQAFTYPGRGHAFARKGGAHFDARDADLASARTLTFFAERL